MSSIDQKRIVKNTLMLYFRMGLIMFVSLYTSRVVLDALGETDMGIYTTVAGVVMMFAFLSNTMSTACQRFYAYEMGANDHEGVKKVFSISVTVFFLISFIIFILCETLGLYFLYKKIRTEGRLDAAVWIFQFAIISFIFTIMRMPYQGMVVIKEKMKVFAYISIFEAIGNLGIALVISHSSHDRLILYGLLMLIVNILVSTYYFVYCTKFYEECRYHFCWDTGKFKEIFSFAGWNMVGSLSGICKSQGLTILLNIFFGNAIVSARAMAYKVYSTLQQFSDNFIMAIRPQIIKSYSAGDKAGMFKLVYQGTKFSYYLLYTVCLPILVETPIILDLWLKDVPNYTVIFTRLLIINSLIDATAVPLATAMQAYGKIRDYHLICGGFTLSILSLSYIALKLHYPPESVLFISIVVCTIAIGIRLVFVHNGTKMPILDYLAQTIKPLIIVTVLSCPIPILIEYLLPYGWGRFFIVVFSSLIFSFATILAFGLTRSERRQLINYISLLFDKIRFRT